MKQAVLPNGMKVSVSTDPQAWWFTDGSTGYVSPHQLAPDPEQPRKVVGGGRDWDEFKASIRESGVREYIRVTPRDKAPWVKLPEGSAHPFIIVSGHRRHRSATEEALQAVPIIIKIYSSQEEYEDDADILNVLREGLTPLEQAYQIKRRRERKHTWEKIKGVLGFDSTLTCQGRLRLLNLAPDIQAEIDPVARKGKRSDFPINVAQELGKFFDLKLHEMQGLADKYEVAPVVDDNEGKQKYSFALQRAALNRIQSEDMKSTLALEFLANGRRRAGYGHHHTNDSRSPAKRLKVLAAVLKGPTKGLTKVMNRADVRKLFEGRTAADVEPYVSDAREGALELLRLLEILQSIHEVKVDVAKVHAPTMKVDPGRSLVDEDPETAAAIAARYGLELKETKVH